MTSIKALLADSDAVLIGAGAGLSAAAGIKYSGFEFQREFADFIDRYGITDLYSSSFYPFKTEEERWAYWAKHVMMARITPPAMPLYRQLLSLVAGKPHFVITTNTDGQFRKAGFDPDCLFEVQGDYAYIQPRHGTDGVRFDATSLFQRMAAAVHDCRIPSEMVPYYKDGKVVLGDDSGEIMDMNLRINGWFVEDDQWHRQAKAYSDFLERYENSNLLLLELGVGFNTPTIIRIPFDRMAQQLPAATLVRANRDEPQSDVPGLKRFISLTNMQDVVA